VKIENILSNFIYKTKCMLIRHDVIDMDTVTPTSIFFTSSYHHWLLWIQDLDTAPLLFEEHYVVSKLLIEMVLCLFI